MLDLVFLNVDLIILAFALLSLALGTILSRIYKRAISPFLLKLCDKTPDKYNTIFVSAFSLPTTAFILFLGVYGFVYLAFSAFGITLSLFYTTIMHKLVKIAVIVYLTWGIVRASDIFSELLKSFGAKLDLETGKTASKFLGYIFRGVVLCLAGVIIFKEFGYDVNGLIAGLGLGGLTVALAAKDSASNFFGGVIIIFEKPFEIGDWISSEGVEGTVEDISFRSTKIRTIANAITVVPNSLLASQPITNGTRMKMRRAQHTLTIDPKALSSDIENVLMQIRELLLQNEELVTATVLVRLVDFTAEGINISIVYFTKTTDFAEHQNIKEKINLKILDIIHTNNIALTVLRK